MQQYNTKQINKPKTLLAAGVASVLAYGIMAFSLPVGAVDKTNAMSADSSQRYVADIDPLNRSNVDGTAEFVLKGNTLKVKINATGLEPGLHPQHIHGLEEAKAECPAVSADVNNDGFVSVVEGAPDYGPIKMNLTSPQTAFGTPPTPALFAPFAGTADNNNFPLVGEDGKLHFVQKYTFDNSEAAQAAFTSITPLGDQHVVLHGGTAPLGVDADAFAALGAPRPEGFNPNELAYDVLLPVGCGEIDEATATHKNGSQHNSDSEKAEHLHTQIDAAKVRLSEDLNRATQQLSQSSPDQSSATNAFAGISNQIIADFDLSAANATSQYRANMSSGMNTDEARNQLINSIASSKDHSINKLNEARNQLIDQLNQQGSIVAERDMFLSDFDKSVDHYNNELEKAKNKL